MYTDGLIVPESVYVEPRNDLDQRRKSDSFVRLPFVASNGYAFKWHRLYFFINLVSTNVLLHQLGASPFRMEKLDSAGQRVNLGHKCDILVNLVYLLQVEHLLRDRNYSLTECEASCDEQAL